MLNTLFRPGFTVCLVLLLLACPAAVLADDGPHTRLTTTNKTPGGDTSGRTSLAGVALFAQSFERLFKHELTELHPLPFHFRVAIGADLQHSHGFGKVERKVLELGAIALNLCV